MKKKSNKERISKKGLAPGTPVYVGRERSHKTQIEHIFFNEEEVHIDENFDVSQLSKTPDGYVHWVNINGIHDVALVNKVCDHFQIHSLTVEDILNTFQRPKSDDFDHYIFFTLKMLNVKGIEDSQIEIEEEQISFLCLKNTVISFQEKPGDVLDSVRDRLQEKGKRVRQKGSDYLTFALLDLIVDNYFEVINYFNDQIEDIEVKILDTPQQVHLNKIQDIKYDLINIRKHIYPIKEAVMKLLRSENPIIIKDNLKYYNDLLDHIYQLIEHLDILRDLNGNQREMYVSMLSLKMNKVMEFLTIITSLFIPLTFIVGVYGMNFKNMPELDNKYGYPMVWIVMATIVVVLLLWFKRRRWL